MVTDTKSTGEKLLTMGGVELDPATEARLKDAFARHARNFDWYQAHAPEICDRHRGKFIRVADGQVFAGDDLRELDARVRAACPDGWDAAFRMYVRPLLTV